MGSKKHKKESKKKKHRSRSRSPLDGEERERKRHKKHKDRKKDRSPDVEEVPVDSHLYKETEVRSGHRSESAERDRRHREHRSRKEEEGRSARGRSSYKDSETDDRRYRDVESSYKDDETRPHKDEDSRSYRDEDSRYTGHDEDSSQREEEHRSQRDDVSSRSVETEDDRETSPVAAASGAHESMSVEQTNRLRAKLGLKPLEVADKPSDDGKFKDDLGEFYHKPAVNITQQKKTDKIREKLEERKEKRKIEQKLKTTLLAEGSDDEDAMAWVMKSRDIEKQKQEAAKRAAMLDEMDAVFGVSALVAEDEQAARQESYTARELRGLRVAHDIDAIGDERETVLTLADREVLAEEDDMLVNVNMVDDERYKKNIDVLKKAKAGYQAYDDEAELEAAALGYQKPVLSKYDEEINKGKPDGSKGFVIGDEDALEAKRFKNMMRQERLQGGGSKRLESLQMPALQIASDYMDHHEIEAKFKKFKRKGKSRKRAKQEPIDVDDYDPSNAPLETDDTEVKPELLQQEEADEDEVLVDSELQTALARARRLRQQEASQLKVEDILERVKEEPGAAGAGAGAGGAGDEAGVMVLDATAEFCRTLGDIPTYGLAGNRDKQAEIMDFEREELEMEVDTGGAGAWSRVDTQHEKPPDLAAAADVGLEAEPALGAGVGGALRLALSKGYLERAGPAPPARAPPALLHAKHYSIEDKAGGEDDKYGRRERGGGGGGPLQDFREKTNFKPNIKLEYVDDDGRPLCQKEAFRYLSHKFHGKGPGKNKQEKRIKKQVQEGLMKKMSSTDTPLGTLQMLQEKQRETHSPFIVLSGAKREPNT